MKHQKKLTEGRRGSKDECGIIAQNLTSLLGEGNILKVEQKESTYVIKLKEDLSDGKINLIRSIVGIDPQHTKNALLQSNTCIIVPELDMPEILKKPCRILERIGEKNSSAQFLKEQLQDFIAKNNGNKDDIIAVHQINGGYSVMVPANFSRDKLPLKENIKPRDLLRTESNITGYVHIVIPEEALNSSILQGTKLCSLLEEAGIIKNAEFKRMGEVAYTLTVPNEYPIENLKKVFYDVALGHEKIGNNQQLIVIPSKDALNALKKFPNGYFSAESTGTWVTRNHTDRETFVKGL